jgi:2-polyprenyl-3-methyl-5-hydroxy-6-metoxy-1,4-benzoquinol methylase/predicted  nucleic acid-binding Zn-ribbon protein
MTTVPIERGCWCGNRELTPFNSEYDLCPACGTLVAQVGLPAGQFEVVDDETDFYGKQYWLTHQQSDLGIPDIHARARDDLTERNLHWLRTLLKYRVPPASALELGCAHGSFVALLRQAGFDASGVEISPWVVEFGRKTFDAPVLLGPLESLRMSPATLDVIVAMDVLEHLPDPGATMATCLSLLKPDGLLLIQTPQLTEDLSYHDLVEAKAGFLEMLIPKEHIYLFSRRSLAEFFRRLGAQHVAFEPAIFSQYDMFAAVSRNALAANSPEQIDSALLASPGGRIALAMLDLRERELDLARQLEESRVDRTARGDQIESLTAMVNDSEKDRAARAEQIDKLTAMLNESEADRTARGRQIESLTNLLKESEADRANRATQIETLTATLAESEADRSNRGRQLQSLTSVLAESDVDRVARATELDSLNAGIDKLRSESLALTHEIDRLNRALEGAEGERAAHALQIDSLIRRLKDSEDDRAQHARQVESLVGRLKDSEDDRAQHGRQAESLLKRLKESADSEARRAEEIAALQGKLTASEAHLSAHVSQIESLMGKLREVEEHAAAQREHIDTLNGALRRLLQRRGLARMARLLDWPEVAKLSAALRTRDE